MGVIDTSKLVIVNYEQVTTRLNKAVRQEDLSGGEWRTIRGSHVYIKDGKIIAGANKGKSVADLKGAGTHDTNTKENGNRRESGQSTSGNNSRAEGRGQDGQGNRGNAGSLRSLAKKSFEAQNDGQYTYHHIEGEGSSEAFHGAIRASKEGNPYGAFVHAYEKDEYDAKKLFISDGGEAGMAVTHEGDIVSVFNNPNIGTKKGVAGHMLEIALQNGGNKLDCFDGFLTKLYSKYGFEPVARMKFSREYAPEGWNFERDGEPDVLFFAHNGDSLEKIQNTKYPMPDLSKLPYLDDYDDGAKLQKEYLENRNSSLTKSLEGLQAFLTWK